MPKPIIMLRLSNNQNEGAGGSNKLFLELLEVYIISVVLFSNFQGNLRIKEKGAMECFIFLAYLAIGRNSKGEGSMIFLFP